MQAMGATVLAAASIAPAFAADLLILHRIEPGLWDIRPKDTRDGGRTMCVADPAVLLSLGHPGQSCSRFAISNEANQAVVHYTCSGTGSGQTSLRVETPRLLQIETQGILRQTPFQMGFEARRLGTCTSPAR
ncbi:MAG: DUF3617 domain-containing protein [Chakrabartia sp.]